MRTELAILNDATLAICQTRAHDIVKTIGGIQQQVTDWLAPLKEALPPRDLIARANRYVERVYDWTQDDYREVAELVSVLGQLEDRIKVFFDPVRKPANEIHKSITGPEGSFTKPLKAARDDLRAAMGRWQVERTRIACERAAAERARLLHEATEKRLAEALAAEAWNGSESADTVLAAPLEVPPVVMPIAVPRIAGTSVRMKRTFRITDASLIPREYLMPNELKLQLAAEQLGSAMSIAGVKYHEEPIVSGRRR